MAASSQGQAAGRSVCRPFWTARDCIIRNIRFSRIAQQPGAPPTPDEAAPFVVVFNPVDAPADPELFADLFMFVEFEFVGEAPDIADPVVAGAFKPAAPPPPLHPGRIPEFVPPAPGLAALVPGPVEPIPPPVPIPEDPAEPPAAPPLAAPPPAAPPPAPPPPPPAARTNVGVLAMAMAKAVSNAVPSLRFMTFSIWLIDRAAARGPSHC